MLWSLGNVAPVVNRQESTLLLANIVYNLEKMIKLQRTLNISTFNVRGLTDEQKQEFLHKMLIQIRHLLFARKLKSRMMYIDYNIGEKHSLALQTDCIYCGNGFVISAKWKENLHRYWQYYWKVSDRISVLHLLIYTDYPAYYCEEVSALKFKDQQTSIVYSYRERKENNNMKSKN